LILQEIGNASGSQIVDLIDLLGFIDEGFMINFGHHATVQRNNPGPTQRLTRENSPGYHRRPENIAYSFFP
jgi:hypothetical protein